MILTFADKGTHDIFDGRLSKKARHSCPAHLTGTAYRKLHMLNQAETLSDLEHPPGNRLEALKGELSGYYSIRINRQFRIIFRWSEYGPFDVAILDYHT